MYTLPSREELRREAQWTQDVGGCEAMTDMVSPCVTGHVIALFAEVGIVEWWLVCGCASKAE